MISLWNDAEAAPFRDDPKAMRVYSSRLLGRDPNLVLHGGGNTSVKLTEPDFFGQDVDLLFVKGSGWDLATIEIAGFTPLRLDVLRKLAQREQLSDTQMVEQQRVATLDPQAPSASVEAILHAIIPHRFVDHTHADSIIAITNSPNGQQRIGEIYGERVLIVPYVMPGFELARTIHQMTRQLDWSRFDGMVLMQHGLFTFDDDPQRSYEMTIELVAKAESWLQQHGAGRVNLDYDLIERHADETSLVRLAGMRRSVSRARGVPLVARWNRSRPMVHYSKLGNIADVGTRGPVTPDHSIRAKRIPLVLNADIDDCVQRYVDQYREYFQAHHRPGMSCLDPAPRWVIWPNEGTVSFGSSVSDADVIDDIAEHTAKVVQQAEAIGGWCALSPRDVFEVEYWELEQVKLKSKSAAKPLQGKVALVTGAASGIGHACAQQLLAGGAAVVAADIDPAIESIFCGPNQIGTVCDVNQAAELKSTVAMAVAAFGGLDIVVSNAGVFSQGESIAQLSPQPWEQSLQLNLTQHKNLMQASFPFLRLGLDATFIVIGSKNVAAPGPGAAAYSVAKAGLNQLMRVAALEWGADGIRVNIIHPDCVYDTKIWAGNVLQQRAAHYGLTTEQYMTRNVLRQSVTSAEVGLMAVTMASSPFLKTTGAQFPIDGGNDRVI